MTYAESSFVRLVGATLAAVGALYLYSAFAGVAITPSYLDPSRMVYVSAVALAGLTVKQAVQSRSNLGHSRGEEDPSTSERGSYVGSGENAFSGENPGLVDETGALFGETSVAKGHDGDGEFPRVGSEFDGLLEASVDYEAAEERRKEARRRVLEELRSAAGYYTSLERDVDLEEAEVMVSTGDWTDAPRAASLLADEAGPDLPWRYRLIDLLSGRDLFLSSVEETVGEIREGVRR